MFLVLSTVTGPLTMTSVAHPPPVPAHGINETTFYTLWSGDADTAPVNGTRDESAATMRALANGTDIPLDSPPIAVERWNRGDLGEFPATDRNRSIHPPTAALSDGVFIKDAHATLFTIQPSTRARLSPTDQPLYVPTSGRVLGTVDYRVEVPASTVTFGSRVFWSLHRHRIVETRLLVDGIEETTGDGAHTTALEYAGLEHYAAGPHTITFEADIAVGLTKRVERCVTAVNGTCIDWDETTVTRAETVTVADTVEVVPYSLSVSGYQATYPNGDRGFVVFKSEPFLGYSLPGGMVRGVWRFYVARDNAWDTLVTSTTDGEEEAPSPLHPLQITAYPIEPGPTPSSYGTITILDTYGPTTAPPILPDAINLDVLTEPYTASFGIVARTTAPGDVTDVYASGLVRGVTAAADPQYFPEIPINRSNLTLTVRETTDDTITVRLTLRDAATGRPIDTSDRPGYVVLAGERGETSANGTLTRTLARTTGSVSARFEPGPWWDTDGGYTADDDVVYAQGLVLAALSALYQLFVPVSSFLMGVFLIDRLTEWRIWPPWRGL